MNENPDQPPAETSIDRLRLPRRTTPTWEIELLISGALVFSLFSLRQPLEDYFFGTMPVATELARPLILYSYIYAKLVLFVLLITFVLHLTARARWVALVGVHSIYPKGPKWENLGGGPLTKRLTMSHSGNVDDAIERADNLASLIFGYGMLAATLGLVIMLMSLVAFSVTAVLRFAGMPEHYEVVALVSLALLLMLPIPLDKYVVPRLGVDHWFSRLTDRVLRLSHTITLTKVQQPLNSLITTNFGGKRGAWVLVGLIYVILGLGAADTYFRLQPTSAIRGSALAEASREFGLFPAHYLQGRTGLQRLSSAPFINDEIVSGPYLRLTLPYVARRHDPLLAEHCPLTPADASLVDAQQQLARRAADVERINCFGGLFEVRLDGSPLLGLEFQRVQPQDGGPDGAIAMIDVRELALGRHTLELNAIDARPDEVVDDVDDVDIVKDGTVDEAEADEELPKTHAITFWR